MEASRHDPLSKWLYADLIVGAHTCIILMERRIFGENELPISQRSLRSGRAALRVLIDASEVDREASGFQTLHLQ
jgi:hypothetical protein